MHKKIKGSAQVSQTKEEIQSLIPAAMLFPTVHMASILSNQPFLLCVSNSVSTPHHHPSLKNCVLTQIEEQKEGMGKEQLGFSCKY